MSTGSPSTAPVPRVGHTGPGPMPGTDVREAAGIVVGECPDLPFLPLLDARGLGSDELGRTAAMLLDLPVDVSPRAWRLADSPGRAGRRAADLLERDLDALEEAWERARGAAVDPAAGTDGTAAHTGSDAPTGRRVQLRVTGPWSLAAGVELPGGRLVLSDPGARRDLAASLLEGVAAAAGRLAERLGAPARVVLEEHALWEVVAGAVPGPSDLDPVAAVPAERVATAVCRFAAGLRERGVAEVLVRPPAVRGSAVPAAWAALVGPPRGEIPVDGLVLDAGSLRPRHDSRVARGDRDAPRDLRATAALDAAGTALGEGMLLHLEGPHRLVSGADAPRDTAAAEGVAAGVLGLLDRLAAPRWTTLDRLVLTPTEAEMRGARPVRSLAGAARTAAVLPRVAQ